MAKFIYQNVTSFEIFSHLTSKGWIVDDRRSENNRTRGVFAVHTHAEERLNSRPIVKNVLAVGARCRQRVAGANGPTASKLLHIGGASAMLLPIVERELLPTMTAAVGNAHARNKQHAASAVAY